MGGMTTPAEKILMRSLILIPIFLFFSLVLSSIIVHFEPSPEDLIRIESFQNSVKAIIDSKKDVELENYLEENVSIKYSQFSWLEDVLHRCLDLKSSYNSAYVLIKFGVRIKTEDLQTYLFEIIFNGDSELLELVLDTHMTAVEACACYEELLLYTVDVGSLSVMEVLLAFSNLMQKCSTSTMTSLAKNSLESGKRDILDSILGSLEAKTRKLVLRSLVKISTQLDRFFIVQLSVDEGVTFLGLEREILFEILMNAAQLGCIKTTVELLKSSSFLAYVKHQIQIHINPGNIARNYGHDFISEIYTKLDQ